MRLAKVDTQGILGIVLPLNRQTKFLADSLFSLTNHRIKPKNIYKPPHMHRIY
uniref:Uncharacterized protein n=1 Tax=Uncultured archaeon GZfos26G2 TaxID=3386331 RepID=Q649J4_UNCAG|nr:hypothetical protein GZ35A2_8 [uncultured archaeon GZfos35A2]